MLPHVDAASLQESISDTDPVVRDAPGFNSHQDSRPGPGAVDNLWRRGTLRRVDGGEVRTYAGGQRVEEGAGPERAAADWLVWDRLSDGDREFVLIGLHLIASWTQPSHDKRRALAKRTLREVVDLADEHDDVPVIVVGDFNAQARHPALDILTDAGFDIAKPPEATFRDGRRIDLQAIANPEAGPRLAPVGRDVVELRRPFDHDAFVVTYEWR